MSRKKDSRKTSIELTQRAIDDLLAIERYSVAEWGRKTAGKYLDSIAAALDRLSENPSILRLEPEFSRGLYFYRIKKHVFVCDLQDHTVVVLTVVHTSMDLPNRLLELEPRLLAESEILQMKLHPRRDTDS